MKTYNHPEYRVSIFIIEYGIITEKEAADLLDNLMQINMRLPKDECEKLSPGNLSLGNLEKLQFLEMPFSQLFNFLSKVKISSPNIILLEIKMQSTESPTIYYPKN